MSKRTIACHQLKNMIPGTIRVLLTTDPDGRAEPEPDATGPWYPARRNTDRMRVAVLTDIMYAAGNRRTRFYFTTDIGKVNGLAHNRTFILATVPEVPRCPTPTAPAPN